MWKIIALSVWIFYVNSAEATYNSGIKTRVYEHQPLTHVHRNHQHQHQHHQNTVTPTHGHYGQYGGDNSGKDYQTSITSHYVPAADNTFQQQEREGDYYQQKSTTGEHPQHRQSTQQQQHPEPIYERSKNSQIPVAAGAWQKPENSITEYYTGCPVGHTGQLPYAYDCRRFLNCWHGRGHIQTCSVGTVFNPETLECDRPDKAKCEAALGQFAVQSEESAKPSSHGSFKLPSQENHRGGRYTDNPPGVSVEVLCPAGAEGIQPHPSDCTRFVNCANGNMHIQQCGPGTAFSIPMKVCDFKHKVDCSGREGGEPARTDSQTPVATVSAPTYAAGNAQHEDVPHTSDILCLSGITGLFPYPFDYTKFINCKNGNTAIQNCVPDTAFSISKGYCETLGEIDKSDHVMYIVSQVSNEFSQSLITCPPGTDGIHLYPFNAELYVQCVRSQMKVEPCSSGHVFNTVRRNCLPQHEVSKKERVRLLSELQRPSNYRATEDYFVLKKMIVCPLGLTGSYPHPFDSTKYLKCLQGRLMSESCASGKAFSLSRKICSLKEETNADDYVPHVRTSNGQGWRVSDMEVTHGSIDGLTYLMCPPGVDGYFLHPFDCTKYIECTQGGTNVDNCLNGAVFSISRRECIPRDKVEAYDRVEYMTTTKNEFSNESQGQFHRDLGISCNPGTFGIYPHPHDCHKYIRCSNGRISVESCATGQVFSLTRSVCHNENEVDNRDRSSYNRGFTVMQNHYDTPPAVATLNTGSYNPISIPQPSLSPPSAEPLRPPSREISPPLPSPSIPARDENIICPPGASGRHPHPLDCTKFLICSNGKTTVQDCAPDTAWSQDMEVCDFKEKVGCGQRPLTSSAAVNSDSSYHCPAEVTDGLYHHPYDCHKYLVCSHGQATVMSCAPGTVFSVWRRTCDVEANVANTDRSNNGVNTGNYDYTSSQNFNRQDSRPYGPIAINPQNSPTQSSAHVTGNRWTNSNIPRPQTSTSHHQTTTWQQSSNANNQNIPSEPDSTHVWSDSSIHVDQHNPTHTVIFEEGSFEPDPIYNRPMYNTPLAPLAPLAPLKPTTTSTTTTVVYAQPVGSQEDSKEIFSSPPIKPSNTHIPQYFPTSNRQNFTRHLNTWTPVRPVDIPRHDLANPYQGQNNVYTNTRVQIPIPSQLLPPYQSPQSSPELRNNLPAGSPPRTHADPHYDREEGGQKPLSESEFKLTKINTDQIPGQISYNLNDFDQEPSSSFKHNTNDFTNLYGGLQPPLSYPLTTTTPSSYSDPYEETTQVLQPPKTTTSLRRVHPYPQLSNATIQTFPHQPHYSPPYAEVAHSRNASWLGRKVPQYSAIKPQYKDSIHDEDTNVKITSTPSPKYNNFNPAPAPSLYSTDERLEESAFSENPDDTMKAALKLLLRPYLDSESKVDDGVAEKAQSHIMNLVLSSDPDIKTTKTPHKAPTLNQNSLVPTTTPHQDLDAELILAGEQHNLVGVTTIQTGNNDSSTPYNLYQTPLQSERTPHTHTHVGNWHKEHHRNTHHSKFQHNREFHNKHPNLPNPFDDPTTSHSPRPETTSSRMYDFDLRIGSKCPFDCGNGQCVEQHQICDGVNNCGNRKDEHECDHLGYELRLTGGQSSHMGRVEVKILGNWGYVCDDKFGLRDADVVCRELGFKMGAMEVRGNSHYPASDVNVYFAMDEVECKGNETSLKECDFKGWGVNNCGPDEVVGVVCKVPKLKCPDNYWLCNNSKECIPTAFLCDVTPDCGDGSDENDAVCNAPIKYRLEGGRSPNEGRLEVFYRGEWGTVCDDDFGLKEAQVLCNSFGLYGKPEIVKNIYGPGSGPIWLDQVLCLGNETAIDECSHWSWGENNCNHTEDVGIKCTAGPKPSYSKAKKIPSDDSLTQEQNLESTLQLEQTELDDLGLYQGLWQRSSKAIHRQKKCGHFKANLIDEYEHPEERVVNGTIAKRGRHPWQATIRTRGRGGISSHWCGAVIISKKLVLTAAHCLAGYPKGSYFVRMGDHYANIAESSEVDSNIENWYIHEKFRDEKHMNNDIALILLKSPVTFNDYVQPICLPEKEASLDTNRVCTISGWGSIKSGTSTPSNILRSAQVPILADEVCSQKNIYANAMTDGMFCAGFLDETADACDGDSGGPLVCADEDGETLYGIISWGQHCGYANHPGVYVRVAKYIDWIYEKINLIMQQGKL